MIEMSDDVLNPIVDRFLDGVDLTPSERLEVLHIARGFACKDSAVAIDVSPETIRARRKRIYRKLRVGGAAEMIAGLLGESLEQLARGAVAGAPVTGGKP